MKNLILAAAAAAVVCVALVEVALTADYLEAVHRVRAMQCQKIGYAVRDGRPVKAIYDCPTETVTIDGRGVLLAYWIKP